AVLQARGGPGRPLSAVRPVGRRPPAPDPTCRTADDRERSRDGTGPRPGSRGGRRSAPAPTRHDSRRTLPHGSPRGRVLAVRAPWASPQRHGQPLRDTVSPRSVVAEGRGQPEGRVAPIRSPLWMLAMRTRPPV